MRGGGWKVTMVPLRCQVQTDAVSPVVEKEKPLWAYLTSGGLRIARWSLSCLCGLALTDASSAGPCAGSAQGGCCRRKQAGLRTSSVADCVVAVRGCGGGV